MIVSLMLLTQTALPQDTVEVFTGWNNVGSLGTGMAPELLLTVPPGIITTSFFSYSPGAGYRTSDTLRKGVGYWIKVSEDGYLIFGGPASPDSCGTKTVSYAGRVYHTIQIGNQCWLKENLNVGTMIDGAGEQTDNASIEKFCYQNDTLNCASYGGFYQWDEAMQYATAGYAQGICPAGWHIPLGEEFSSLSGAVSEDGNALKSLGQGGGGGAGTNTSGFSALLSGCRSAGGTEEYFYYRGLFAFLWTSGESDATTAGFMRLHNDSNLIDLQFTELKSKGFSVRCIED